MPRWDTVDEMLACLSPEQLLELRAARAVVPLEDGWRQAGTIAASAHNNFERSVAVKFLDRAKLRSPDDYIPKPDFIQPTAIRVNQASIDASQAAMEARYLRQ